jgi:hypothetical protein
MTSHRAFAPPETDEYDAYYHRYVCLFQPQDFLKEFAAQAQTLELLLGDLPTGTDTQLHAPYTWTLKQVVGHMIDCERIFSTRLLRIASGDETPNPGFDQNECVAQLAYDVVTMTDLLDEFSHLRSANVLLAKRLTTSSLARRGTASDSPVSARANLYILAGHVEYHVAIIQRRLTANP